VSEVVEEPTLPTPAPTVTTDTAEFWSATAQGQLLLRRCNSCSEAIWYPRPICPFCHSTDTSWQEASGSGSIYSFTVVRRSGGDYANAVPYVLAYVQLAEGPRMMTNIVECELEDLFVGQEVELVFHKTSSDAALPRFRPR
jgi:hypothetical protein